MPKLSVIVPIYNTEKYLRECIDSILAQTFTDFELILVDDGSTDGSGAICDEYAAKDQRVRVIHQENGGVTRARKAAMGIAAGSWVSFIDADDWISPEMLDAMMEKAMTSAAQIVICDAILEHLDKSEIAGSIPEAGYYDKAAMMQRIYPTMIMDFERRRPGIAGSLCNKIFGRNLLEKVFWFVEDSFVLAEDALCTYAAIFNSESMYIFRNPWYHYRQHEESAMHQYNGVKRYKNLLRSYNAYKDLLDSYGSDYLAQLNDCVTVNVISNLRNVLLFDKETSLIKRFSQAKEFVSQEIVMAAFQTTVKKCNNRKERFKIILVLHKNIGLLYLLFVIREFMLNLTR